MLKVTLSIFSLFFFLISAGTMAFANPSADVKNTDQVPYVFAVIPFYTPEKIWALYSPFIAYLNKTTGSTWKLRLYHNHDEIVDAVCTGKVSAALLGPVPLGRVNNKCGVKPLLVALGKDGKPDYHSVILTNSPAVASLKDLKGKKIGFFKGSTAAHILPVRMLKGAGVGVTDIQPLFFESQDRIISALLSGEVTAAGVKENLARKFSNEGLKMLAVSQPLPNFSLSTTPMLPVALRQRLLASLSRLKPFISGSDAELMKNWDDEIKNGFVAPDKEFMPSVMELFGAFTEVQKATAK